MMDFLDYRLQLRDRNHLGDILMHTFGIREGFSTIGAVAWHIVSYFVGRGEAEKSILLMAWLSTRFPAAWFAESLCPSDYFVAHSLLARWSMAVAGFLGESFIFGQACFQPCDFFIFLAEQDVSDDKVTLQSGHFRL